MKLQQVLSQVRKAVDDYHMIEENDRIAVGISGGKDSLTLLVALNELKRFYPIHFEVEANPCSLSFQPVTYLAKTGLTVIRPLIYMNEVDVIGFVNKYKMPVVKSPCPADGHTKREYIKNLVKQINYETPGVKDRMFSAIQSGNLKGWSLENGSN